MDKDRVFDGLTMDGKGAMGWWHGFMLHFLCNDCGEILVFTLTGTNVDDRDERVSSVFAKILFGKVSADSGHIS